MQPISNFLQIVLQVVMLQTYRAPENHVNRDAMQSSYGTCYLSGFHDILVCSETCKSHPLALAIIIVPDILFNAWPHLL